MKIKLANGYGSVHKVSGKRRKPYRVRVTVGWDDVGKQLYKNIGYYASYPEAMSALELYHKNPYLIDNQKITFEEVYNKWSTVKYPKLSKSAINSYKAAYNYCSDIYEVSFIDLRLASLEKIIKKADGKLPTQKKIKGLLMLLFEYGMANDIVNKNYAEYLELGKQDKKIIRSPFTEKEINILWKNADLIKHIDIILVLIYTGLRINELFSIEKENIFLDKNYMIGGLKTEAGKNRVIPIHKRIKTIIEKWYNNSNSKYLLTNSVGSKIEYKNFIARDWNPLMEDFGFNHKPHDTRHTFATRMNNIGANPLCTKLILGHSIKDLTERIYTHKTIEQLIEAVNMLT